MRIATEQNGMLVPVTGGKSAGNTNIVIIIFIIKKCHHHHHVIDTPPPVLHGFSHWFPLDMPFNDVLLTKSVGQNVSLITSTRNKCEIVLQRLGTM
jgi:hypothetical protein